MGDEGTEQPIAAVNTKKQLTLNEAYHLLKTDIISELEKRGIEVKADATRDEIRSQLVELVRAEIANADSHGATSSETSAESEAESSMSDNTKLQFHLKSDDWEAFIERMELYFVVKKVTEETMKVATLLTHFDEEAYMLVRNLCAPDKPSTKKFEDLKTLMSAHLNPKPAEVMERCRFNTTRQEPNESVAEFAARLRMLSLHCNFSDLNGALRDQLVCGIHDEATRIELFKLSDLTFEKALKEATACEMATKNAAGAVRTLNNKSQKQEVFAIKSEQKNFRQNQSGRFPSKYKNHNNTKQSNERSGTVSDRSCYCCGQPGHLANACTHREEVCNFCGKKGHLERACFTKKRATNKFLEVNDEEADDNDPADNHLCDFYPLFAKDSELECKLLSDKIKADPMFLQLQLNGKDVSMEVDSGTYYAVVSETFKNKYLQNWKIDKCSTNLYGYEQNEMMPIGQLKNLKVNFGSETKTLNCLLLKGNGPPLIGRQWLAEFGLWPLMISTTTALRDENNKMLKLNINDVQEKILSEFSELFGNTPGLYNKR